MRKSIEEAFADLLRFDRQAPLDAIHACLNSSTLTAEDLVNYLIFHRDRYVRNRLFDGPAFQALVLCWRNGQRSPIHNHRGSHCGVKILRGAATETLFEKAPNGMVVPLRSHELPMGCICTSSDEDIHQLSNLQAGGAELVTLHVYSPPLLRMEMFSLENPAVEEWDDPINDPFPLGAGI